MEYAGDNALEDITNICAELYVAMQKQQQRTELILIGPPLPSTIAHLQPTPHPSPSNATAIEILTDKSAISAFYTHADDIMKI